MSLPVDFICTKGAWENVLVLGVEWLLVEFNLFWKHERNGDVEVSRAGVGEERILKYG